MKIGLRTIKTAVSATLAIVVATQFHLLNSASAGIIAVLSVTNTKKNSLFTGMYRLLSLGLATIIAALCFYSFGYHPLAFGIYLLLFIPLAVAYKLSDGIVVSSVLVTHYFIEKSMSWSIIFNEFLLMMIGVSFALLMNLYMPDVEKRLKEDQAIIEEMFRKLLKNMADYLNANLEEGNLFSHCFELKEFIKTGENWAKNYAENQLFSSDTYYLDYFTMRKMQSAILYDMLKLLQKITIETEQVADIKQLLVYCAQTFAKSNDGQALLDQIQQVYETYRVKELPKTREEFENRARLFQFLQLFESFIETKATFSKNWPVTQKEI